VSSELDLVIKNGTVVTSTESYRADIGILSETITAIGQGLEGRREIDATGMLVTPGAVDIHVHMQMPIGDFVSTDTFFTGTRAARPDESMLDALTARRAQADPRVAIDYGFHMTIGPNEIAKLNQAPDVYAAGCISFKLYMAYGLRLDDGQLMQALEAVRDVGGLPVIHTENWDIICALVARNLKAGNTDPHWHPRSRPAAMEGEAAGRAIDIATMVGVPLHIFHITCDDVVRRVAAARHRGLPISGETCPQYLLLTQDVYDRPGIAGALPVCSPPIRDQRSQDDLWRALSEEELQVVTTDHCPFTSSEKATGLGDFSRIPGGVPSVEIRFPALYSYGVRTGRMTATQWVAACCTNPARLVGLTGKGDIVAGYDADLVIFDPEQHRKVRADALHEQVDWTPYDGLELQGWPKITISRGEIIVEDGQFLGTPGRGCYAPRGFLD